MNESTAKRVYGLKPVSRVQISPSPPHTQVKRRVTVKGNSPFLRSKRGKFGAARGGVHTAIHTFGKSVGKIQPSVPHEICLTPHAHSPLIWTLLKNKRNILAIINQTKSTPYATKRI